MSILTTWYGQKDTAWPRICRAFEICGYQEMATMADGFGAYGFNILHHYQNDLTPQQVEAMITFALSHTLEELRRLQPGDYTVTASGVEPT